MKESTIEQIFAKKAKRYGCKVVKFYDNAENGAPDRIILTPTGHTMFIEFKKPGKIWRADQEDYAQKLAKLGFLALVATGYAGPVGIINNICTAKDPNKVYSFYLDLMRQRILTNEI